MHHDEREEGPSSKAYKKASDTNFPVWKSQRKPLWRKILEMFVGIVLTCLALAWSIFASPSGYNGTKECVVKPDPNGGDDAPAILDAFRDCGRNGKVTFLNETYHVNSVMTTTGLENVEVDIKGTLLVRAFQSSGIFILCLRMIVVLVLHLGLLLLQKRTT